VPIIHVLVILAVIGFLLWLANVHIPMQPTMKKILNFVVIALVIIWLLNIFGVWAYLSGGPTVPRIRH
jgi:hypothetical protein